MMPVVYGFFPSERKAKKARDALLEKGFSADLKLEGEPPVAGIDQMNNPYSGDQPAYIRAIGTDIAVAGMSDAEGLFAPPAYMGLEPEDYLGENPYRVEVQGEPHRLEEAVRIIKGYDGRI